MGRLSDMALTVLVNFLAGVFQKTANHLWDELWAYVFEAVFEAEEKWGKDNGAKKKEWAMDQIFTWIGETTELNFIQRFVARLIVSNLIDGLLDEFNERMGHDWLEQAKAAKAELEGKIPFIG